eukprot:7905020-Alexandrium_andersonii.AAC.1
MAEKRPRYGVLPAGAFDSRPGPGGAPRSGHPHLGAPAAICGHRRPPLRGLAQPRRTHQPPPDALSLGGRAEAQGEGQLG